jgi:hypothetical protein
MNIPPRVDFHIHLHIPLFEDIMNRFSSKLQKLTEAVEKLEARVAEDFAELQRQVEEGKATDEQIEEFNALVDRLHAVDPLPDHPPAPGDDDDDTGNDDTGTTPGDDDDDETPAPE